MTKGIALLLMALVLGSFSGPTSLLAETADDDGIVGTGVRPGGDDDDADGVGGTGARGGAREDPDGIGGTGLTGGGDGDEDGIGGTGVVGVITGRGSIVVNGLKIDIAPQATVRLNRDVVPVPEHERVLAVGQLVELLARRGPAGLVTQEIQAVDAVVGPVEAIDPARGEVTILGQTVSGALVPYREGQWLRVAGLRDAANAIVATRITAVAAQPEAFTSAVVLRADERAIYVGGARIGADRAPELVGRRVWVTTPVTGQRAGVPNLVVRPRNPFAGRAGALVVQGFAVPRGDGATIPGWEVTVPRAAGSAAAQPNTPLTVRTRLAPDGRVESPRVVPAAPLPRPLPILRPQVRLNRLDNEPLVPVLTNPGNTASPILPRVDKPRRVLSPAQRLRMIRRRREQIRDAAVTDAPASVVAPAAVSPTDR